MFAALYLPNFHLQAVLRLRDFSHENPIAIVGAADAKGLLLECNLPARNHGVTIGMPTPQALARCPALTLLTTDDAQERTANCILLEVAHAISPFVEATRDGVCTVELRGEKDWPAWGEKWIEHLARLQLRAQIGVAPNPDLAWLAAQWAAPFLQVTVPELFLRELDISVLQPSPKLHSILQSWGIQTVGQLADLPGADLISRLGAEASELYQRATGRVKRPLRLVQPSEEFFEFLEFDCEIETLEPLLFVLRRMLEQLTCRLSSGHRVANRMRLTLTLENKTAHERTFTIPAPTAKVDVLFRIVTTHLETLHLEHRPVAVRLWMEPARADHSQLRLFENALRDPNRFGETMARLIALVGTDHAGIAMLENTHKPDSWHLEEPEFHALHDTAPLETFSIGLPLRRYRPPVEASVALEKTIPIRVNSAVVCGAIVQALGPYRRNSGWWDQQAWACEEWDVEISGAGLYRLICVQLEWKIAGCYDAALC
ncbi:MAG TPA: DNA polymerase Y family protein [Chthoniobacterales bacterium]|jgi:protein ImuB